MTRGGATYDAEVNAVTARILDVSVPVRPGMHVFEGDPAVSLELVLSMAAGEVANVSALCCGTHTGTHVDAPRHFIDGAAGVETLDIEACAGPGSSSTSATPSRSTRTRSPGSTWTA